MEYNIISTCLTKSCLHTFVETSFSLLRMTTVYLKWRFPQEKQTRVGPSAFLDIYLRITYLSSPRIVLYLSNSARLCFTFSLESIRFSVTSFSLRSLYLSPLSWILELICNSCIMFSPLTWILKHISNCGIMLCPLSWIIKLICNSGIMFRPLRWIFELISCFLQRITIMYRSCLRIFLSLLDIRKSCLFFIITKLYIIRSPLLKASLFLSLVALYPFFFRILGVEIGVSLLGVVQPEEH